MSEARAKVGIPTSPAMPFVHRPDGCIAIARASSKKTKGPKPTSSHQEKIAPRYSASEDYFAMVHTPVSIADAMKKH